MTAATETKTSTAEKLWAALQQAPGVTSKELAANAGIGGSTARKLLVALERTGGAYRTEGQADGSAQRPADLWWPRTDAADTPAEENIDDSDATGADQAPVDEADTPAEVAATAPEPAQPDTPVEPAADVAEADTAPEAAPGQDSQVEPGQPPAAEPAPPEAGTEGANEQAPVPASDGKRLKPGALRGMVEEFLRDCAGREFGPTEIGRNLERSVGAIHNSLEKLVADGIAVKTCEAPKRYMIPNT
ncbi:hypothetical protein [Nocardia sp. NPDC051570]|uniref:hypothetical protein n=1 Tax=Nocardia sp. NPDC051570 TaxID=3364324 RepID=UPI003790C088